MVYIYVFMCVSILCVYICMYNVFYVYFHMYFCVHICVCVYIYKISFYPFIYCEHLASYHMLGIVSYVAMNIRGVHVSLWINNQTGIAKSYVFIFLCFQNPL